MKFIYFFVAVVLVCVWTTIGFLLWVPLLTRVIVIFTFGVIVSLYTGASMGHMQRALDTAIRFYGNGFRIILDTIREPYERKNDLETIPAMSDLRGVVRELAFARLFWFGGYVILRLLAGFWHSI